MLFSNTQPARTLPRRSSSLCLIHRINHQNALLETYQKYSPRVFNPKQTKQQRPTAFREAYPKDLAGHAHVQASQLLLEVCLSSHTASYGERKNLG